MLGIANPTRRLQGWTGVMQVGALQSAVGAGAFSNSNQTMQVGALNTNTSFGGAIAANVTNLTKVGTGSLSLNGNTTYNAGGSLNANGGTVAIDLSNLTTPNTLWSTSLTQAAAR